MDQGAGVGRSWLPMTLCLLGSFMNGWENSPGGHNSRYNPVSYTCQKLKTRWVGARAGAGG